MASMVTLKELSISFNSPRFFSYYFECLLIAFSKPAIVDYTSPLPGMEFNILINVCHERPLAHLRLYCMFKHSLI